MLSGDMVRLLVFGGSFTLVAALALGLIFSRKGAAPPSTRDVSGRETNADYTHGAGPSSNSVYGSQQDDAPVGGNISVPMGEDALTVGETGDYGHGGGDHGDGAEAGEDSSDGSDGDSD